MCRSIKTLRVRDQVATPEEIEAAALQFVRKVSGYRTPSARNREAFDAAVDGVTAVTARLLEAITRPSPPGPLSLFKGEGEVPSVPSVQSSPARGRRAAD